MLKSSKMCKDIPGSSDASTEICKYSSVGRAEQTDMFSLILQMTCFRTEAPLQQICDLCFRNSVQPVWQTRLVIRGVNFIDPVLLNSTKFRGFTTESYDTRSHEGTQACITEMTLVNS